MKVNQKELQEALTLFNQCIKPGQYPLQLEVSHNYLSLTFTNGKTSMTCAMKAEHEIDIDICVSLKEFTKAVGLFKGTLEIEVGPLLKMSQGKIKASVKTKDSNSYPDISNNIEEKVCTLGIPCDTLQKALISSYTATGKESFGKLLSDIIALTPQENNVLIQSFNGSEISIARITARCKPHEMFVLPDTVAPALQRLLGTVENDVDINVYKNKAVFTIGKYVFHTPLVATKFPDTRKAFDFDLDLDLEVDNETRDIIFESILRAHMFAKDGTVRFQFTKDLLTLSSSDESNYAEEIVIPNEIEIEFNLGVSTLLEYLKHLGDGFTLRASKDPKTPVYIHKTERSNIYRFLTMKKI
jgi:DNA polymerase III sliding clamp (beta) subunit (PCNA family)